MYSTQVNYKRVNKECWDSKKHLTSLSIFQKCRIANQLIWVTTVLQMRIIYLSFEKQLKKLNCHFVHSFVCLAVRPLIFLSCPIKLWSLETHYILNTFYYIIPLTYFPTYLLTYVTAVLLVHWTPILTYFVFVIRHLTALSCDINDWYVIFWVMTNDIWHQWYMSYGSRYRWVFLP